MLFIFSLSGYSEVINERESQLSKSTKKDAKGIEFYLLSKLIIKEIKQFQFWLLESISN